MQPGTFKLWVLDPTGNSDGVQESTGLTKTQAFPVNEKDERLS